MVKVSVKTHKFYAENVFGGLSNNSSLYTSFCHVLHISDTISNEKLKKDVDNYIRKNEESDRYSTKYCEGLDVDPTCQALAMLHDTIICLVCKEQDHEGRPRVRIQFYGKPTSSNKECVYILYDVTAKHFDPLYIKKNENSAEKITILPHDDTVKNLLRKFIKDDLKCKDPINLDDYGDINVNKASSPTDESNDSDDLPGVTDVDNNISLPRKQEATSRQYFTFSQKSIKQRELISNKNNDDARGKPANVETNQISTRGKNHYEAITLENLVQTMEFIVKDGKDKTLDQPSEETCNHHLVADGPELLLDMELDESSFEKWPDVLAKGCQQLISEVKKKEWKDASQSMDIDSSIEIRPVTGYPRKWKLSLRRDAVKCYQKYGKKSKKIQTKYMVYGKRISGEHEQDGSIFLNRPKEYKDIPKLTECETKVGAGAIPCNFYVCEPYCIIATTTYYAAARSSKERVITISPHDHESNEQWVQKPTTWEIVREVINVIKTSLQLQNLPFEQIYSSFGCWQSQTEHNRLMEAGDCHAHINIVLTEEAMAACKGRVDKLGVLKDSIFAPTDYRFDDAIDLHRYIDYEDEFEKEASGGDDFDNEPTSPDVYYSFSQPLLSGRGRRLRVELRAKSSIIHNFLGQINRKISKVLFDVDL